MSSIDDDLDPASEARLRDLLGALGTLTAADDGTWSTIRARAADDRSGSQGPGEPGRSGPHRLLLAAAVAVVVALLAAVALGLTRDDVGEGGVAVVAGEGDTRAPAPPPPPAEHAGEEQAALDAGIALARAVDLEGLAATALLTVPADGALGSAERRDAFAAAVITTDAAVDRWRAATASLEGDGLLQAQQRLDQRSVLRTAMEQAQADATTVAQQYERLVEAVQVAIEVGTDGAGLGSPDSALGVLDLATRYGDEARALLLVLGGHAPPEALGEVVAERRAATDEWFARAEPAEKVLVRDAIYAPLPTTGPYDQPVGEGGRWDDAVDALPRMFDAGLAVPLPSSALTPWGAAGAEQVGRTYDAAAFLAGG